MRNSESNVFYNRKGAEMRDKSESNMSYRKGAKMQDKRWERVDSFVRQWKMVKEGDAILLGISGGADSICLARYFLARRETFSLKLYAVHINHMLRGEEAKRDEEFVRDFCREWNLPLNVEYRNIKEESRRKKCSEEEAGRIARYECFEKYAAEYHCEKIAVAHHQNDAAETILFRMLRGTGAQGMAGILPVNGKIVRPFLCLDREEITDILQNTGQDYVNDSTNKSEEYSRNYIRHRILPEMEHVNQKATAHISELGMQMQELLAYITPRMEKLYEDQVTENEQGELFLSESAFARMSLFEQKEMLRRMLFEISGHRKDISLVHVEQLLALMANKEGKQQNCPYGVLARKGKDGLLLMKLSDAEQDAHKRRNREKNKRDYSETEKIFTKDMNGKKENGDCLESKKSNNRLENKMQPIYISMSSESKIEETILLSYAGYLQISGEKARFTDKLEVHFSILPWNGGKVAKRDCVKYFDYDKMKCKPCLRTRDTGDYFIMDKEGRRKSLGRYFIDTKIPASDRDGQLLLADGSHIMWIIGGRISEFYKVSSETKRVLKVSVQMKEEN